MASHKCQKVYDLCFLSCRTRHNSTDEQQVRSRCRVFSAATTPTDGRIAQCFHSGDVFFLLALVLPLLLLQSNRCKLSIVDHDHLRSESRSSTGRAVNIAAGVQGCWKEDPTRTRGWAPGGGLGARPPKQEYGYRISDNQRCVQFLPGSKHRGGRRQVRPYECAAAAQWWVHSSWMALTFIAYHYVVDIVSKWRLT